MKHRAMCRAAVLVGSTAFVLGFHSEALAWGLAPAVRSGTPPSLVLEARVVCERFRRGNQMITRYCEDGYECDLANQKCTPGPAIRQRIEAERQRQEAERQRRIAELEKLQRELADRRRALERDMRRMANVFERRSAQRNSDDWRRIPSPQYGRGRPGAGCSTITGLPETPGGAGQSCGSGRGAWAYAPARGGATGGGGRAYQPPRPSPRPEPRLVWRQQQAQWSEYLGRIGDAIARTEPGDPARQALAAHRSEARKAFEEQRKVHVTEELPHDDMIDAAGRSTTAASAGGAGASSAGGAPGQSGAAQPGAAAGTGPRAGSSAAGNTGLTGAAGEGGGAGRDLVAEEEACARAREKAARGGMALFAVAEVPAQCLADVNRIRAETAAKAGIDPAPLFSNSADREIIRAIQTEFRPERPDAGPPDTQKKS